MTAAEAGLARTGGCSCGAVRFSADGAPNWVAHCHCSDCRRATGAAFSTYVGYPLAAVRFDTDRPAGRQSSPGVVRRFCPHCGTPISYEGRRWADEIHLFVCTFDDPALFQPTAHVYVSEQLPWLRLADGLPSHLKTADGQDADD